jgi:DNA-binding GntR family transcriptional regulator
MPELTFPQIDHTALGDKVYEILKRKILERELRPGDKVLVDDVAQQLGVSRTPVKDALNRLAVEGLIEKVARRGTFVTTVSLQEVDELFDLRLLLETYAAEKVLERGVVEPFLAKMEEYMVNIDRIADSGSPDYYALMSWNRDLHLALITLADNNHLLQIYEGLNIHIQVARVQYLHSTESVRQTQREHRAIYEAFESGDLEQVKRAISTHINNVRAEIIEAAHMPTSAQATTSSVN